MGWLNGVSDSRKNVAAEHNLSKFNKSMGSIPVASLQSCYTMVLDDLYFIRLGGKVNLHLHV